MDDKFLIATIGPAGITVGLLLSWVKVWVDEKRSDAKRAKVLSIAIAGELAAVAKLIRYRRWLEGVEECRQNAEAGNVYQYSVRLPEKVLVVTREAMKEIGLLTGNLPLWVPEVVLLADGISADLQRLHDYPVDHEKGLLLSTAPKAAAATYAELYGVLARALEVCDSIVREVAFKYREAAVLLSQETSVSSAPLPADGEDNVLER